MKPVFHRIATVAAFALAALSASCFFSTEATPDCCQCMIGVGAFGCSATASHQECVDECCSGSLCCREIRQWGCEKHCPACKSGGECSP